MKVYVIRDFWDSDLNWVGADLEAAKAYFSKNPSPANIQIWEKGKFLNSKDVFTRESFLEFLK